MRGMTAALTRASALVLMILLSVAAAEAASLRVIHTFPPSGAFDVAPDLKEIKVWFSAPVRKDNWTFEATTEGRFPKITGRPSFEGDSVCVLPVRLKPDTTYSLSVNSPGKKGFRLAADKRVAAEPFVLTFTTASLPGQEPAQVPETGPAPMSGPQPDGWDPRMAGIWLYRSDWEMEILELNPDFTFQLANRSSDGIEHHQGHFTFSEGVITAQPDNSIGPYIFTAELIDPDTLQIKVTAADGQESVINYKRQQELPDLMAWTPPSREKQTAPTRPAPAETAEQIRQVWPLYFMTSGQEPGGISKLMTVRVAPTDQEDVRVGFFESEVMASGHQWRVAGWMATVMSGFLTGRPTSQWRISFDVAGRIDGPSAGGLMTCTLLSAILNQPVLPGVTMTGTINPDGTIGPVSGIYYKLKGAKDAGLKKVLIPFGVNPEKLPDGREADLYDRAKELGLELVEVENVYQAYSQLTGHSLPQAQDDGHKLELPERARLAAAHSFRRWQAAFKERITKFGRTAPLIPAQVQANMARMWRAAYEDHREAVQAFDEGKIPTAWAYMLRAAVVAEMGEKLAAIIIGYQRQGLKGAKQVFNTFKIDNAFLNQFLDKLEAQPISNVNDLITIAEAYGLFGAALGQHLLTEKMSADLDQLQEKPNEFMELLGTLTALEVTSRDYFNLVDDFLFMGLGHPGPNLPPLKNLVTWGKVMRRAAEANLHYIDKTIVEPAAKELGQSPSLIEARLMQNDSSFQLAALTRRSLSVMLKLVKDPLHQTAAALGGLTASWSMSGLVVAKHYSLGFRRNENGEGVTLESPQLLTVMLKTAKWQLRNVILRLEKEGVVPIIPLFHLQIAQGLAASSNIIGDQLWGLSEYWLGSTYGRLFLAMGRPQGR